MSGHHVRATAVSALEHYAGAQINGLKLSEWVQASENMNVHTYCKKMTNRNAWGGALELLALSLHLKRNIVVYTMTSGQSADKATKIVSFGDQFVCADGPITLLYVNANHYVALKRMSRVR